MTPLGPPNLGQGGSRCLTIQSKMMYACTLNLGNLVLAHGVLNDPVEFFVFWTFIPAFMHHGSGGDGWAGGEGGWVGGMLNCCRCVFHP